MASRSPAVAGQFYPGTADELRATIRDLVDESATRTNAVGIVIPHAGYVYSGAVSGDVISRINLPETCIIIGPNHTGQGAPFSIMTEGSWKTPLGETNIDSELARQILKASGYLKEDTLSHAYEHSIEVQLPFLQYLRPDIKLIPIIFGHAGGDVYKQIGRELAGAVKKSKKNVLIIASSDMTHYESRESASRKDNLAIEAMLDLNADELLTRVSRENITMCGYAPAVAVITASLELGASRAELVRYQNSGDVNGDFSSVVGYAGIIFSGTSSIAKLAREAVETYIREGKTFTPETLTPELKEKAGVFVSIHKNGELRGCIGTFEPTTDNIAEEIIVNGVSSATRDPRFHQVTPDELKDLDYSVDVLSTPEPIKSQEQLDPGKYGVIVQTGYRRGLLLPDLEGVNTPERQIDICRQKAGIGSSEPVKLYRFEVKRYK